MADGAPDEFRLIAELFAPLSVRCPGAHGLTDDAAFLPAQPGTDTVVTVDTMVAGVHFLPDDPPELIARKLIGVNLSDLAAKGAVPQTVFLAAAFPREVSSSWLTAFAAGLKCDLDRWEVALAGGDTVATPGPLTLTLTALGRVEAGRGLLRSGARPGHGIWVSGSIGDGALGLKAIRRELAGLDTSDLAELADRYRLPRPRVLLGPRLIGLAAAAMDISDGLLQDLAHICRASGVGAEIEAELVPLSPAAALALAIDQSLLASILTGGDDYELLFTAAPEAVASIQMLSEELSLSLRRIGRITGAAGDGVVVLGGDGQVISLAAGGWRHFAGAEEKGDTVWSG